MATSCPDEAATTVSTSIPDVGSTTAGSSDVNNDNNNLQLPVIIVSRSQTVRQRQPHDGEMFARWRHQRRPETGDDVTEATGTSENLHCVNMAALKQQLLSELQQIELMRRVSQCSGSDK